MKVPAFVFLGLCAAAAPGNRALAQTVAGDSTLRVYVEAPGAPGASVTIRYLVGPDSLRGKTQNVVAPSAFTLHVNTITLFAAPTKGQGTVRLRVERGDGRLTGEGTAEQVRIEVTGREVQVRAFPRTAPI